MRWTAIAFAAVLLWPGSPARADQTDARLDGLFEKLATSENPHEAQPIEGSIWRIWIQNDDNAVNTLMAEGLSAMQRQDYRRALRYFDQMVAIAPDFAEAWNKRATVHYMLDNYENSLADIDKTLALEPRHFGALSGRGLVYTALDRKADALASFESALSVHPNLIGARQNAAILRKLLKDEEI